MAFESLIVAFVAMFFLAVGVSLMGVVFTHQRAMQIAEYGIMMIEHHNRYDRDIDAFIAQKAALCKSCSYVITPISSEAGMQYEIQVHYTMPLPVLSLRLGNRLYALTTSVG